MKHRFYQMMKTHILLVTALILMIVIAIVIALLPPLVLKQFVDEIQEGHAISLLRAVGYFIILALAGVVDATKEVLITKFGQLVTKTIRQSMCEKLDKLEASYFTKNETGKIVSLFVGDVDTIQSLFSNGIISMVIDGFQIISIFIVIFFMSKGLGIVLLFVVPLLFAMTRLFQKRMLEAQFANRKIIAKVTNHIPETIKSIRTIQNLRKQSYMENKYQEYLSESYQEVEKSNFYDSIYSPIIVITSALIVAVIMYLSILGSGFQAFFGMSAGTAVALIAYINNIFSPIENLGMEIQNIQEALAGVKRVRSFMEEKEEKSHSETISSYDIDRFPAVSLSDVTFGYEEDTTVLSGIHFIIQSGEKVTLTGRTGCGKSTLFKLFLGLYTPQKGEVLIYGKPASLLSDSCKREIFGYVEQNFHMIVGTVRDQITLGDDSISMEDVKKAACVVGLDEAIEKLEHGYEEPCDFTLFSQGQFQLLSIARAVVKNPKIMLLDEITANLDSQTEEMVLEALEKVGENRTVISISHRTYRNIQRNILIR